MSGFVGRHLDNPLFDLVVRDQDRVFDVPRFPFSLRSGVNNVYAIGLHDGAAGHIGFALGRGGQPNDEEQAD